MTYSVTLASLLLNNHGYQKVLQWKLDLQHYDTIIEHIPGEENILADVFSRLVQNQHLTKSWLYSVWILNGH